MQKEWDVLWINGCLVTGENGYGLIDDAALAIKDGKIAWLGKRSDLTGSPEALAKTVYDMQQGCLTPGLIDCHTHLIYAGDRAHEFAMRLKGHTYEEIARSGGGIQSTVNATRSAPEEILLQQSLKRARTLLAGGVTTVEIKSGYGLDLATETKILRVAQQIASILPLTVKATFLGAHTIPLEYRNRADDYVDHVCNDMIPFIAKEKLADAVDVFCEKIAFTLEQTEKVFQTAQQHHLKIKCHAEQLSDSKSAALAAKYGALSADHLEHASSESIHAMQKAGTAAVLLPGAFYFLRETVMPPIALLRKYQVPIAIATDCNPGTSPTTSLLLMLNMACTLFRLTPEEAFQGVTSNAAIALGLEKTHGTLSVGKAADLALWDITHPDVLAYNIGANPLRMLVKGGERVNL